MRQEELNNYPLLSRDHAASSFVIVSVIY